MCISTSGVFRNKIWERKEARAFCKVENLFFDNHFSKTENFAQFGLQLNANIFFLVWLLLYLLGAIALYPSFKYAINHDRSLDREKLLSNDFAQEKVRYPMIKNFFIR